MKKIFSSIYLLSFTIFLYLIVVKDLNYVSVFSNPDELMKITGLISLAGFIILLIKKDNSTERLICIILPIIVSLGYIIVYKILVPILYFIGGLI